MFDQLVTYTIAITAFLLSRGNDVNASEQTTQRSLLN